MVQPRLPARCRTHACVDKPAIPTVPCPISTPTPFLPPSSQDLETLRAEHASLRAQLQALAESDPEAVDAMREATRVARDAANRWTDNIWCLASWVRGRWVMKCVVNGLIGCLASWVRGRVMNCMVSGMSGCMSGCLAALRGS